MGRFPEWRIFQGAEEEFQQLLAAFVFAPCIHQHQSMWHLVSLQPNNTSKSFIKTFDCSWTLKLLSNKHNSWSLHGKIDSTESCKGLKCIPSWEESYLLRDPNIETINSLAIQITN